MLLLATALPGAAPAPTGAVDVRIEGVRSAKGLVRACLTRDPASFPHCEHDPDARKQSVPAAAAVTMHFGDLAPGMYAITVLHDANANAKPDMFLGIPREGIGFSRNPRLITGPPSFASARFHVAAEPVAETVTLKYFL